MNKRLLLLLALVAVCCQFAWADSIVFSFGVPGVVAYLGGASPFFGLVSQALITGNNTPANNGVSLTCTNCGMTFFTGPLTSSNALQYFFTSGGGFSIDTIIGGSVTGPGFAGIGANTHLVSGDYTAQTTVTLGGVPSSSAVADSPGIETVGALPASFVSILTYFGLPTGPSALPYIGSATFQFNSFSGGGGAPLLGLDVIVGTLTLAPAPEPAAFLLLAMGLGFIGVLRQRRR